MESGLNNDGDACGSGRTSGWELEGKLDATSRHLHKLRHFLWSWFGLVGLVIQQASCDPKCLNLSFHLLEFQFFHEEQFGGRFHAGFLLRGGPATCCW